MSEPKPYFVRGDDGILLRNPGLSPFERRSYHDPEEALNVHNRGKLVLGCTHRRFEHYSSFPCGKTPKHDPDANGRPTKCGIHSAEHIKRRNDKRDEKFSAEQQKWERQREQAKIKSEMLPLIRSIADGHNDPRTACTEWLNRYEATLPKEETK